MTEHEKRKSQAYCTGFRNTHSAVTTDKSADQVSADQITSVDFGRGSMGDARECFEHPPHQVGTTGNIQFAMQSFEMGVNCMGRYSKMRSDLCFRLSLDHGADDFTLTSGESERVCSRSPFCRCEKTWSVQHCGT